MVSIPGQQAAELPWWWRQADRVNNVTCAEGASSGAIQSSTGVWSTRSSDDQLVMMSLLKTMHCT